MYYPKSQIKTNLYTKGGELKYLNNNKRYQGYYWVTSKGNFFSGKNPNSENVSPLIPLFRSNKINNSSLQNFDTPTYEIPSYNVLDNPYNQSKNIVFPEPNYPVSHFPIPTEEDYEFGEINRYFLKKRNEYKFIEINKYEYRKYIEQQPNVPYPLFQPFQITWDIKGREDGVYNVNYNTVKRTEKNLNVWGFEQYWKGNFSQLRKD